MKIIAEKLRLYLQEKNLTVADFAREIGVNADEVEKMLNGHSGGRTDRKKIHLLSRRGRGTQRGWRR
jgi:transcriptional regulator with XRE-family HTH domain